MGEQAYIVGLLGEALEGFINRPRPVQMKPDVPILGHDVADEGVVGFVVIDEQDTPAFLGGTPPQVVVRCRSEDRACPVPFRPTTTC